MAKHICSILRNCVPLQQDFFFCFVQLCTNVIINLIDLSNYEEASSDAGLLFANLP